MTVVVIEGRSARFLPMETRSDLFKGISLEWRSEPESYLSLGTAMNSKALVCDQKKPYVLLIGPCSSSIDVAWHFQKKSMLPEWGSVLAPSQWNGKGQFGREWISPSGNIYGAMHLSETGSDQDGLMPVVLAYLMIKGLEKLGVSARLKWPNDMLINDKKVGGILIEDRDGVKIAGVGLNLCSHPPDDMLRCKCSFPAGDLKESGFDFKPVQLWLYLMEESQRTYDARIKNCTRETVVEQIRPYLAYKDSRVLIDDSSSGPFEGTIQGIAPDGGLELMTDKGLKGIYTGRISPMN